MFFKLLVFFVTFSFCSEIAIAGINAKSGKVENSLYSVEITSAIENFYKELNLDERELFGIKLGMDLRDFIEKFPSREITGEDARKRIKELEEIEETADEDLDFLKDIRKFEVLYPPQGFKSLKVWFHMNKAKIIEAAGFSIPFEDMLDSMIQKLGKPHVFSPSPYSSPNPDPLKQLFYLIFEWNYSDNLIVSCWIQVQADSIKSRDGNYLPLPILKVENSIRIHEVSLYNRIRNLKK